MAHAKLVIKKRMQFIQGKTRPCCYIQAIAEPEIRAVLDEHFLNDALFKRAAYAQHWPKGAIEVPAPLAPALTNFLKNDACPEITVKTLLAGQLHQGANIWEMLSFELVAKLAFDNFLAICDTIPDLTRDIIYEGQNAEPKFDFRTDDVVQQLERVAAEMAA
ncbi:MAG: hypothetical protein ABL907_10940 [Hyphomicrobium sp.]